MTGVVEQTEALAALAGVVVVGGVAAAGVALIAVGKLAGLVLNGAAAVGGQATCAEMIVVEVGYPITGTHGHPFAVVIIVFGDLTTRFFVIVAQVKGLGAVFNLNQMITIYRCVVRGVANIGSGRWYSNFPCSSFFSPSSPKTLLEFPLNLVRFPLYR